MVNKTMPVKSQHNVRHTVSTPITIHFKKGLEEVRPNVTKRNEAACLNEMGLISHARSWSNAYEVTG